MRTEIELGGLARTNHQVAEYMASLNESKMLGRVDLQYSKEFQFDDSVVVRFKIKAVLASDVQITAADVAQGRRLSGKGNADGGLLGWLFGAAK